MPFRYVFKRAGVDHPVGYSLAMLALGMLVCMMVAVTISVQASDRAIRESERQQRAQRIESRRAACLVIVGQDEAYRDPAAAPVTAAGKRAAAAWRNLRQVFQCDKE